MNQNNVNATINQESSDTISIAFPNNANDLLASKDNIILELFGGKQGQVPGAINVDIIAEQGIKVDLLTDKLSFVKSNSVQEIVAVNPYIPRDAGGAGIMDYLPEAARVLEPGGKITIIGSKNNKFTNLKGVDLDSLGLEVVGKYVPLPDEYSGLSFNQTDGTPIKSPIFATVLIKKN